jgi:hypothetical protein
LNSYYSGDWAKAKSLIKICKGVSPEFADYYDAMNERLDDGKAPKDWDGTYRATSK